MGKKILGPPLGPEVIFLVFFSFFFKFLKLWKLVLNSWGRCLKAILQTRVPENFLSC